MQDILPYLGVEKSFGPEDLAGKEIVLEDYSGLTAAQAERKLKTAGLRCRLVGTGETITGQIPAPGQSVPGNSEVLLYLDAEPSERMVTVPDFSGMHRQQAAQGEGKYKYFAPDYCNSPEYSQRYTGSRGNHHYLGIYR